MFIRDLIHTIPAQLQLSEKIKEKLNIKLIIILNI